MKTTGNLGLKKPDGTDIVDIADLNGNMDILDTAVKSTQDHMSDAVRHITAAERTAWNAKASTAAATASAAGLMAAADKAKLDGVAAGANNYVHPNHTGDVISTGDGGTAIAPGVIVNADVNAAAAIDASKIGTGTVSNAEFGYLDGVTGNIQTQLNNRPQLGNGNTFTNNQKIISTAGTNAAPALSIEGVEYNAALQLKNTTVNTGKRYSLYSYNGGDFAIVNETDGYSVAQVDSSSKIWTFAGGLKSPNIPQQTTSNITYYVRTDGNDNNTGLTNTAAGAFKTIGKAISGIPQIVDHSIIIQVAAGTYAENLILSGFQGGGYVGIFGTGVVNVSSMVIERCTRIQLIGITFTSTTADAVNTYEGNFIEFKNCVFTAVSSFNAITSYTQIIRVQNCTFSNRATAIQVIGGSAYILDCTGTNNITAILPSDNAIVRTLGTIHAGAIFGFLYGGLVNPWGENNGDARTYVEAVGNVVQNVSANTVTKMLFANERTDFLNEYTNTLSRFVAQQTGRYMVSASVVVDGFPTDSMLDISVYVNGTPRRTARSAIRVGSQSAIISVPIYVFTGEYIEIYFNCPQAAGVCGSADGSRTYLIIQRMA